MSEKARIIGAAFKASELNANVHFKLIDDRMVVVLEGRDMKEAFSLYTLEPARMTFQVQLYPATQEVELHYCSLTSPPDPQNAVSGGSATVGLESPNGLTGAQHSFNQGLSVTSTTAIRFTPN